MDIILASTSPYRRQLLARLLIPFRSIPPQVEENRLPNEPPFAMAARLAREKARAVAQLHPESLVIGSDQVASLGEHILGKPGTHKAAFLQLQASSAQEVCFYTGVAICSVAQNIDRFHVEPFSVHFRELDDKSIENYLLREQPYDCAGSFKVEGLGITLFARLAGSDPTSLEGMPLIALTELLREVGFEVLRQ